MFDLAWSEIALIGVVALVVIGPKDLPGAVRGVANMVKKARRMAGEFQGHVDEMVREANLEEVRDQIKEIRNFNIRDQIEKAVDTDGSLRRTFSEDLTAGSTSSTGTGASGSSDHLPPAATVAPPPQLFTPDSSNGLTEAERAVDAPSFIPPGTRPPPELVAHPVPEATAEPLPPPPPAFIPPSAAPSEASPAEVASVEQRPAQSASTESAASASPLAAAVPAPQVATDEAAPAEPKASAASTSSAAASAPDDEDAARQGRPVAGEAASAPATPPKTAATPATTQS